MAETSIDDIKDFTKSPIVTVRVGTSGEQFYLHKAILTSKCPIYFAAALDGQFLEAHTLEIDIEEESPEAFALFVDWLYRDRISDISTDGLCFEPTCLTNGHVRPPRTTIADGFYLAKHQQIEVRDCVYHDLYYMAEKWCIDGLKNQTIDCIRKFYAATQSFVPMHSIVTGYRNTYRNSPLREYLYRCAAFYPYTKEEYLEMQEEPEIVPDVMAFYKRLQRSIMSPDTGGNHKFHVPVKNSMPATLTQAVK